MEKVSCRLYLNTKCKQLPHNKRLSKTSKLNNVKTMLIKTSKSKTKQSAWKMRWKMSRFLTNRSLKNSKLL